MVLGAFAFVFAAFTVVLAWTDCRGLSASLGTAVQSTLELVLTISSPAQVLSGRGSFFLVVGWVITVFGWLLVPLLVGALFEVALGRLASEKGLRIVFEQLGISRGLPQSELGAFVNDLSAETDRLINEKKAK